MKIFQLKNNFRYNTDSVLLYNFASNFNLKGEILEVGSGCGIIGILLKRDFPKINLTLLEILNENCKICELNCKENNILANIVNCDFATFKNEKKFDFIVSNPPFYRKNITKSKNKFLDYAKNSENLPLETFIKVANSLLKPQGELIFCYKAEKIDEICKFLNCFKLKITNLQFCHTKSDKNANLVLIRSKKSSKSLIEILPPIFVTKNDNFSKIMQQIYKKTDVFSEDFI